VFIAAYLKINEAAYYTKNSMYYNYNSSYKFSRQRETVSYSIDMSGRVSSDRADYAVVNLSKKKKRKSLRARNSQEASSTVPI